MFLDGIDFLLRGGPMMWPLILCAIVSVAVMIERALVLRRAASGAENATDRVRLLLEQGRDEDAQRLALAQGGPVGRVVGEAIRNRNLDPHLIESKVQEVALAETPKLSQRMNVLDTIITIAPLLGLLGTVTGMIKAFHIVGDPSALNGPTTITGDVAEALIATATGLAIAIITLVGYNTLGERVKSVVSSMELAATQVVNILTRRAASVSPPPLPTAAAVSAPPPTLIHEPAETGA